MRHYLNLLQILLPILLGALLLAACGRTPLQEQQAYVFGTRVEVLVVSSEPEQGRKAIAAVLREFDRLHRVYHAWKPSELSDLNSAIFAGRPQQVTPELADFVREAQQLGAQGEHLFDPGIGQLIKLWGFQADEFKSELPAEREIKAWLASKPSIADLTISENTITSRNRQVALDFGGYLKGVALDRAAAILRSQGIDNALINIGGNVMALGSKEGRRWRVGIQHPRQPGPMGYPADHTQAVTVLVPAGPKAGTLSDAASKPIFIAGPNGWRAMAKKMEIGLILRVDRNGRIFVTEALQQRLAFIGQTPEMAVVP